ncbi:RpnC/YadD family protein [Flavilitoribacter nigricans]|uniref:Transposase (putative) YhgA-like domain-containing protein n=1 Tax=Flavilitoribacter nigricans (strain ATCC 23147 / DSM 23189 / NBRC 102662 / NCIMB 1420 / SS-2) TaxID=1122177 RepID=A0A2D0MYF1_FLAN2|nr:hypothetical protein [Flavilitoribacter nigricans]PHN01275.1 hypothetical protein CRP01_37995 [Flavilitoribacter nigricans DSM 23189 = NBRC 102662]
MIRKDTLWKGIIEDLAEEFVRFFFAEYLEQFDLSKGFVFLDKELEQLVPASASPARRADKLFKAWLLDGQESWFLVHVEVQGYSDPNFPRRMFEYAYRIQDRYQRPVTALVLYTDTDRRFHFSEYRSSFFGTEILYRFRTFILMDYPHEELHRSNELFGWVLEVARRELELRRGTDLNRFQIKLALVRYLFQQGVARKKIRHLLDFIGAYLPFEKSDFLHKFEKEIQQITKSRTTMGIREAIINDAKEQGFEQGIEQGIEQGLERGIEQGIEQKERKVVTRAWAKGFPIEEIAELADMPIERVESIIREIEEKESEGE